MPYKILSKYSCFAAVMIIFYVLKVKIMDFWGTESTTKLDLIVYQIFNVLLYDHVFADKQC